MSENQLTAAEIERVTKLARRFLRRRPWLAPHCSEDDLVQEACIAWYACADARWPHQEMQTQLYKIAARMLPGCTTESEVHWLEQAYRHGGLAEDDVEAAVELGWLKPSEVKAWRKRLAFWSLGRCYSLAYLRWQRRLAQLARIRSWLRGDPAIVDADSTEAVDMLAEQIALRAQIADLLGDLEPRHAQVLRLSFGLEDNEELTDREIGKQLNRSAEYVSQMRQVALRNMRHPIRSRRLRDYYGYPPRKAPAASCSNL